MTTEAAGEPRFRIEPFDPKSHDRTAFSCGVDQLDNFLKRTARKHQKGDFTRVWVAVWPPDQSVLGYYAINAHGIEAGDLPETLRKRAPRHGQLGAAYLSMIAADAEVQGQGLGRLLLADALKRVAAVSSDIGIFAVVLDVLDDGDTDAIEKRRRFYERFGFIFFPSQPLRMFLPVQTIRDALSVRKV
jgi:GNAT superfamily N-acetyltransferase